MRLAFANSITLSAITAGLWVVLWGPAYGLAGTSGVQGLSFAAVLCVVPGCVVLLLSSCSSDSNEPLYQAAAVGFATIFRMLIVLSGVWYAKTVRPDWGWSNFLVWLVVFYLATLAVESWFALSGSPVCMRSASK